MMDIILKPIKLIFESRFFKSSSDQDFFDDQDAVLVSEEKENKDIYTTLSAAREEIWRRWNDEELKIKIQDFLGKEFPDVFRDKPKAVLFRFIATPNFEFRRFFDLSKLVGLDPVYAEFLGDKFCTRNDDKVSLGRITVSNGKDKKRRNIIDLQKNDNKKFSEIETLWGGKLVDFHHAIFSEEFGDVEKMNVSIFKTNGESAKDVYVKFLALFLCNGVLFENYILKDGGYEKKFTNTVVFPAINELKEKFGIKPLIVPLLPITDEEHEDWMWYPYKLDKKMDNFCK